MDNSEPKITVSIDMKVNLGNYESASVGIILSQLPAGATEDEIDTLLDTGQLAYDRMRERLKDKVLETRTNAEVYR